jgi:hypothetical protein
VVSQKARPLGDGEKKEKPGVRITNQFRRGQGMVYDLSCDDVRLTLEITTRSTTESEEEWHVEAFARESPGRPTLDEPGGTRIDALRAVARSWAAKRGAYGFPALNWDGVTEALLAVRAI